MISSVQMLNDCEEKLNKVEGRPDVTDDYLASLRKAISNARQYRWSRKEVAKLWEEIEAI